MLRDSADGSATMVTSLQNWAAQPFNSQMSLSSWFLFTGLIIVAAILWVMILRELKGEILS